MQLEILTSSTKDGSFWILFFSFGIAESFRRIKQINHHETCCVADSTITSETTDNEDSWMFRQRVCSEGGSPSFTGSIHHAQSKVTLEIAGQSHIHTHAPMYNSFTLMSNCTSLSHCLLTCNLLQQEKRVQTRHFMSWKWTAFLSTAVQLTQPKVLRWIKLQGYLTCKECVCTVEEIQKKPHKQSASRTSDSDGFNKFSGLPFCLKHGITVSPK